MGAPGQKVDGAKSTTAWFLIHHRCKSLLKSGSQQFKAAGETDAWKSMIGNQETRLFFERERKINAVE